MGIGNTTTSMNASIHQVEATVFQWNGNHGTAVAANVGGFLPYSLLVRSPRTGEVKSFRMDMNDPSAEDHWDGELTKLVDDSGDFRLTIWWEQPLF
jgi:hypothetical protein